MDPRRGRGGGGVFRGRPRSISPMERMPFRRSPSPMRNNDYRPRGGRGMYGPPRGRGGPPPRDFRDVKEPPRDSFSDSFRGRRDMIPRPTPPYNRERSPFHREYAPRDVGYGPPRPKYDYEHPAYPSPDRMQDRRFPKERAFTPPDRMRSGGIMPPAYRQRNFSPPRRNDFPPDDRMRFQRLPPQAPPVMDNYRFERAPFQGGRPEGNGDFRRRMLPPSPQPREYDNGFPNKRFRPDMDAPPTRGGPPPFRDGPPPRSGPPFRGDGPPPRSGPPFRGDGPPPRSGPPFRDGPLPPRSGPPFREGGPPSRGGPPFRQEHRSRRMSPP